MARRSTDSFPRGALYGAAALVGLTMFAAAGSRLSELGSAAPPAIEAVRSLELRFLDEADGSVSVVEAPGDRLIAKFPPGTNGFARALLRGLARERKRQGVGSEPPFRLLVTADGVLSLIDPVTDQTIELQAFGPTNAQVFAQLLASGSTGS